MISDDNNLIVMPIRSIAHIIIYKAMCGKGG
jgi:hypothetical protein